MYSNNILNFQKSTTILNAHMKKSLETYRMHLVPLNKFHSLISYTNLISFRWFLSVLSQRLTPVLTLLFFINFVVHFWFSKPEIAFSFLSWCLSWSANIITFLTTSILLFLHQILDTTDCEQSMSFNKLHWGFSFLNEFYNPFDCFNWQFLNRSHVSFLLGMPNGCLTIDWFAYLGFC